MVWIVTEVRQSCALSPIIVALVVDWMMARVTVDGDTGVNG